MRTPDVAARNVVVMAGSTVRTVGERLGRCRGRARAPAGRQPGPWRSLPNATMPISHRPPPARVAVVAPPRRRDYVSSPRRLASARRLTGVVATEATTPRRRVRHAAHRRVVERVGRRHRSVQVVRPARALSRPLWASLASSSWKALRSHTTPWTRGAPVFATRKSAEKRRTPECLQMWRQWSQRLGRQPPYMSTTRRTTMPCGTRPSAWVTMTCCRA